MAGISSKNTKLLRFGGFCGIFGSGLALILVLTATVLSPWFSWENNALSELGVGEVSLLFNTAMLIGGLFTFFFALGIREYFDGNRLVRIGVNMVMISSIFLALVGIFTVENALMHGIVSLGPLILGPSGIILLGFGIEESKIRKLSIWNGVAALASILILTITFLFLPFKFGYAIPVMIDILITIVWILLMGTKLIKHKN